MPEGWSNSLITTYSAACGDVGLAPPEYHKCAILVYRALD